MFYKNVDIIRCYVSESYNKNFIEDYGHIFHLLYQVFMLDCF